MLDDDYGGVAGPDDEPTMPNGAQGSGRRPGALRRDGWAPEISKDLLVVLMKHRTCREGTIERSRTIERSARSRRDELKQTIICSRELLLEAFERLCFTGHCWCPSP